MTEPPVRFDDVDACLAFIRRHAAELVRMPVELEEAEAAYVNSQAAAHGCTADEMLSAITITIMSLQHRMLQADDAGE